MCAPAAATGPVPGPESDRRRYLVESSPFPVDYFPSGPKPRSSRSYEDGTLPTASPAWEHNTQTLEFRYKSY